MRKIGDRIDDIKTEIREFELDINEIKSRHHAKIDELRLQYFRDNNINI